MSNDTVNVQRGIIGKGQGNDTYILASSLIEENAQITVSDVEGSNTIQLIGGLSIVSSIASEDTLQLTLSNGAVVTVLGASSMNYSIGGNPLTGEQGVVKSYQSFATDTLGVSVPDTGITNGGASSINSDGTATLDTNNTSITESETSLIVSESPDNTDAAADSDNSQLTVTSIDLAKSKSHSVATYGTVPVAGDSPAVESGHYWKTDEITYSFSNTQPDDYSGITGFIPFPDAAKAPTRAIFDDIETFTTLTFTEVDSDGDIRLNAVEQEANVDAYAYYPSISDIGGDIFLNNDYTTTAQYADGSSPYFTLLHEMGHAIGLSHSFEGISPLSEEEENTTHSVMSYTKVNHSTIEFTLSPFGSLSYEIETNKHTTGFSYYDVIALQAIYGVNPNYNDTDTVYTVNFDNTVQEVIWDAGGVDTIDASSATGTCLVDLRESQFSSIDVRTASQQAAATIEALGLTSSRFINFVNENYTELDEKNALFTGENNLVISQGVWIENAITGSANDTVQDNAVDNNISTGSGDDLILLTEGGFDTIDGGSGTDTVQFNVASSAATIEQQADGSYIVLSDNFAAQLTGIETLQFTDTSTTLG